MNYFRCSVFKIKLTFDPFAVAVCLIPADCGGCFVLSFGLLFQPDSVDHIVGNWEFCEYCCPNSSFFMNTR